MERDDLRERRVYSDPTLPIDLYTIHGRGFLMGAHWHPDLEILYVESGSVLFTMDGGKVAAEAGSAVLANPGVLHTAETVGVGEARFHAVVFDVALLSGSIPDACTLHYLDPLREDRLRLPLLVSGTTLQEADSLEKCRELIAVLQGRPRGFELQVKSLLFGWLAGFVADDALARLESKGASGLPSEWGRRPDSTRIEPVKKSLELLHERYSGRVTVAELAGVANLSEFHFFRVFKDATGRSPIEYLNEYRCRRAAERLVETDADILGVALDSGFTSASYFIRVFRRFYGQTPSTYRRRKAGQLEEARRQQSSEHIPRPSERPSTRAVRRIPIR